LTRFIQINYNGKLSMDKKIKDVYRWSWFL